MSTTNLAGSLSGRTTVTLGVNPIILTAKILSSVDTSRGTITLDSIVRGVLSPGDPQTFKLPKGDGPVILEPNDTNQSYALVLNDIART